MLKKLIMLAVSVGALAALVVPASAGAAVLTAEEGVPLGKGAEITVTGPTLKTTTSLGTIECEEVNLFGELTNVDAANDLTEGKGTKEGKANGCTFQPGGQPATVSNISIGNIVSKRMEATANFSYTAVVPVGEGTITCEFATPKPSPLNMTTGTDIAHVAIELESELCGESEITGETTWETPGGAPLTISEGS